MDTTTPRKQRRVFPHVGHSVYLTFAFEHDDDVKSAAIILRDLAAALRVAGKERKAPSAVVLARQEWERAQRRLEQGVRYKEGDP